MGSVQVNPDIPAEPVPRETPVRVRRARKPRLPRSKTCYNADLRAAYLRALPLLGHEKACSIVGIGTQSVRRYASEFPEFAKQRYAAINAYRFEGFEEIRKRNLDIIKDPTSSWEKLQLAYRWFTANSDPTVLNDPDILLKQASAMARAVAAKAAAGGSGPRALPHLLQRSTGDASIKADPAAPRKVEATPVADDPAMREVLDLVAANLRESASGDQS